MFFFFSSRRRHTRLQGDWSSDVCSSDLWFRNLAVALASGKLKGGLLGWELLVWSPIQSLTTAVAGVLVLWLFGGHPAIRLGDPGAASTRTCSSGRLTRRRPECCVGGPLSGWDF